MRLTNQHLSRQIRTEINNEHVDISALKSTIEVLLDALDTIDCMKWNFIDAVDQLRGTNQGRA